MLKELQSLALDVTVLDENGEEVVMTEDIDTGDRSLRSLIEGDNVPRNADDFGDGYLEVTPDSATGTFSYGSGDDLSDSEDEF